MLGKPRVLILVSGGVVQDVRSDEPIDYAVIDADSDPGQEFTNSEGEKFIASAAKTELLPDIDIVDLYWKQI